MKNTTIKMAGLWRLGCMVVVGGVFAFLPDLAVAAINNSTANAVCGIADSFTGEVATGVGTIAVCTIGTMAALGRVQWTSAIVIAIGVAMLFGATSVASTLASAGQGTYVGCP